ncbi:UDP-4-amino-4,6-dideoxy-N-acetyl-beta-L-altrosamine N-acetyltransferase [Alkalihalobacillus sp. AL-G]|uniref:UDP-4-amino-4, 6-dideoxy-N-acetyl-beta-L-altrosamine N-acetyltransferase n=1 Tax=Alkalihalobacillus sp. AL-G TaxID=2926399 RepID=UPI00272B609C|nr:UDP-4-amino-4,6-dideoxy-N-acetyl-beta-L-altrosamine N-acetyltransferase [Alkalihalobacillus sp. AL-G]WLD93086.1 UDP-4-amino-4,6-dideoxy-N-acetyl-beta-L-altrosamine N-acetyltransferase [Alkalihalobacillus sp. AL-G]
MTFSDRIKLVDMDASHLDLVLAWRNQKHIRSVMYSEHVISMEHHKNWFQKIHNDKSCIVKVFYMDGVPMGVVNFTKIDHENSKCEWGFYIGNPKAPKGAGTIMGYLALNFIFEELKIRKLSAEIIGINEQSVHYHTKLGFVTEGTLKDHIYKDDSLTDIVLMALFDSEWSRQKVGIHKRIEGMIS